MLSIFYVRNYLLRKNIAKKTMPPNWSFATSLDECCFDHNDPRYFATPEEEKHLLKAKKSFLGTFCPPPLNYVSTYLETGQLQECCEALISQLCHSPFNLRMYGALRRYGEANFEKERNLKSLLEAVSDLKAYKKINDSKSVSELTAKIDRLQAERRRITNGDISTENTLFTREVLPSKYGKDFIESGMLSESDLSRDIYFRLNTTFKALGIKFEERTQDRHWRLTLAALYSLHRRLRFASLKFEAEKISKLNVDRYIQPLGITEAQRNELERRIRVCFEILNRKWQKGYDKAEWALWKRVFVNKEALGKWEAKVPKQKHLQMSLGLQEPMTFLKKSISSIIVQYQALYQQAEWNKWTEQSVTNLSHHVAWLLRQMEDISQSNGVHDDERYVQAQLMLKRELLYRQE